MLTMRRRILALLGVHNFLHTIHLEPHLLLGNQQGVLKFFQDRNQIGVLLFPHITTTIIKSMAPLYNGHHRCIVGPLVAMDLLGSHWQTYREVSLLAILCTLWRPLTQSHTTLLGGSLE